MRRTQSLPELASVEIEPCPSGDGLRLGEEAPRVTLISPYGDISSTGIRVIAACLKRAGLRARMLFLPISGLESRGDIPSEVYQYPDDLLESIAEHCLGSLYVGVSFMTNYYDRVTQLSAYLRRNLSVPVVLGGLHPTLQPDECAPFADFLCVGEGEGASVELALDLARDGDGRGIKNIWPVEDGRYEPSDLRPLIRNIDSIPFPDYDLDDDYVLYEKQLLRMTPELLQFFMQEGPPKSVAGGGGYYICLTSRGCKYNCSYCCNSALKSKYPKQQWLRYRTPESIVDEISLIKERMPFVGAVFICDDSFFERGLSEIERFSELYKHRVALPFYCLGTPYGITEAKIESLLEVGLRFVQMGIQTGSRRTSKLFRRSISNQKVLDLSLIHI